MSLTRNLVNDKLNINTTSAKGIEKAIATIATFIINAQSTTDAIIYGKYSLKPDEGNLITRALDKGTIYILERLTTVDFCNIINHAISQIPGGKPFNPNDPIPENPIAKKKWQIQKIAFDIQKTIDAYRLTPNSLNEGVFKFATSTNIDDLYSLITDIRRYMNIILEANSGLNDPEIRELFPEVSIASNFIQNISTQFERYTNIENLQNLLPKEIEKIFDIIDKVRIVCMTIQTLTSASSVLATADFIAGGAIQDQIERLNREIPIDKAIPTLNNILKSARNISSVAQKLASYINTCRSFIRIFLILLKAFYVIRKFFFGLPIPSVFTTAGVNTLLANINEDVVGAKGIDKLVKRLQQINFVLNLMVIFVTSLVAGMQIIIDKLTLIVSSLQNCTNVEEPLKKEIQDTIDSLENSAVPLRNFINSYNSNTNRLQRNIGPYAIEIIPEELTDEGISIRRRFGIARDQNGFIVAQSTPTFASLDLIIINEVKFILYSKGLIDVSIPALSPDDLLTVLESNKFLGDDDLDLQDLTSTLTDANFVLNQNKELGLSQFIDNLPGGKSLRKKMRSALSAQNNNMKTELGNINPNNGKTSTSG